jgi:cytochrome c-type biogenesis protein CcsB
VTILDEEKKMTKDKRIFMNNVIDYRGYRFFQSGYDPDEGGTRLSVNHDAPGTLMSYLGYLLMGIGMILSFIAPGGRFRELYRKLKKPAQIAGMFLLSLSTGQLFAQHEGHAHETARPGDQQKPVYRVMSEAHSEDMASLLVLDIHGRVIPFHTLCDQILRKIHRSNMYEELNAVQTVMSMHMYQGHWVQQPLLYVSSKGDLREKLGITEAYISYADLTDQETGEFKLAEDYNKAFQKFESQRNEYDKRLIQLGEHYQVMTMVLRWDYMRLVPIAGDQQKNWYNPLANELPSLDSNAFRLAYSYLASLDQAAKDGRYGQASDLLKDFKAYQRKIGGDVVPSEEKVAREISYNKQNIFNRVQYIYLMIGTLLLILFFIKVLTGGGFMQGSIKAASLVFTLLALLGFLYHAYGIYLRYDISGHAPWSDGYEALVFIASIATLTGLALTRVHPVILAGSLILAFLMLFVADMNLMDPEITPLQPVLKSYWLMIHVAIITGSYGPLGIVCMLAIINMLLYIVRTKKNGKYVSRTINELTWISEMVMMIGVVMLTIGTFLGGVWANESWGRYWGWDPKETWALVAILAYAIVLHFRFVPKLKSKFAFNTASMWAFSTILFTFFGVNFYLVGLHSYAQGEGLGKFPTGIWIATVIFIVFNLLAWWRNKQYVKRAGDE